MQKSDSYSPVIAGTMTWGQWGKQLPKVEMTRLMHHCLEMGITTFDHADIYGGYTNEADFGSSFVDSGISRQHIQLITKCGIQYVCEARDNTVKHYDYSTDYIIRSAERSLKNLQTDYIDLFLLHRPSPLMHPDAIAEAVVQLKKTGKIKDFGVSNFTPSQIALLETRTPVVAHQFEFSLKARAVFNDGTLDDCLAHGRMAMAWSPLGSYFQAGNEQTKRLRPIMENLAEKYNATPDQLLLAWIMKHPAGVHPVVGTTNQKRLKTAMDAIAIRWGLEDWFMLLEAAQGHKVP
ncbi:MAG: aldo/keto reductase [Bacteroidota bacterium]